mgnify:FL=1
MIYIEICVTVCEYVEQDFNKIAVSLLVEVYMSKNTTIAVFEYL